MCEQEPNTKTWIEEKLLPELKNSLNKSNCSVKYEISQPTDSFFMARVIFLNIKFIDCQGRGEDEINLVVKRPPTGRKVYTIMNIDEAFHNEILFYTKYATLYSNIPRLLYASEKPPYDSVIVMENINKQGYSLNLNIHNFQFELVLAAVREIAQFHSNSYIMKELFPKEFYDTVENIKPVRYPPTEDNPGVLKVRAIIPRIIKYLQRQNYEEVFCRKLEKFLYNGYSYATVDLYKPIEPLATLCHGDFTRNNVFFKETVDGIKAKLIDFGMIYYGSPGKDLSLFLHLSGTRIQRTEKFPEIFEAYYGTLLQGLKQKGISNLERFSKDALLEDYKSHAFFGFLIVSIFLPVMLGYFGNDSNVVLKLPSEKICEIYNGIGGEEYTKILVDMVLDLREAGCLVHMMEM
ncbi:uncharacterized protein LOC117168024 [Belonocnema kinseyi]|uniref:uncharacterized protein LOC117168024 n=1 Tax=Belonocnema kinseyi TaxID=2817044 RepID=UPI00143DDB56|nr:uncharacterized protein LOC117168024 [Belonocnema kinseyi]